MVIKLRSSVEKDSFWRQSSRSGLGQGQSAIIENSWCTLAGERRHIHLQSKCPDEHFQFTKRNFLKKIATSFDLMGFLALFTIRSKILLQDMWASGLGWDELLDLQLTKKARKWFSELADLTEIKVPRCLQVKKEGEVISRSLHTFSDASEEAYGAVSYVRYQYSSGAVSVHLVASKACVAPLSATSGSCVRFEIDDDYFTSFRCGD